MNPETDSCQVPRWIWAMMILLPILSVLVFIYWWITRPSEDRMASIEIDTPYYPKPHQEERRQDDLTRIKGIGPKIDQALKEKGVYSFKQLALSNEEDIREILAGTGMRLANLETWSDQARLATLGSWEELEELQNNL